MSDDASLARKCSGGVLGSRHVEGDETPWVRVPTAAFCLSHNILEQDIHTNWLWSTQPSFIPPGSINQVPTLAGDYGGNVTSVGWKVKLCDPICQTSSRSGEINREPVYSQLKVISTRMMLIKSLASVWAV